jgi:hypothetical protein
MFLFWVCRLKKITYLLVYASNFAAAAVAAAAVVIILFFRLVAGFIFRMNDKNLFIKIHGG